MFGRNYARHLDLLMQSFIEINTEYKVTAKQSKGKVENLLRQIYITLFGIPEIGFQIRSLYFQRIVIGKLNGKSFSSILDAGSGIGLYTFWLGKMYPEAHVLGGEIDTYKLRSSKALKREFNSKNVAFKTFDIMKKNNGKFDLIVTIDVLEHVPGFKKAIKNLSSQLKKNGYMYIHVPQPNQKRIFRYMKEWHHEGHTHDGYSKTTLKRELELQGLKLIEIKETFGFWGKLAWELNHISLSRSFIFAGIVFPFLIGIAFLDQFFSNTHGLGVAILAQKK